MSSYLNFYFLPKRKEGDSLEPKPLKLASYCRSSEVYQYFYEEINPAYIGNGDEPEYTEISREDVHRVVKRAKADLNRTKESLETKMDAYKKISSSLSKEATEEAVLEYTTITEFIKELEKTLQYLLCIEDWIADLKYSDFEKVLINID